ncbi:MAG: DUF3187 domain-containing protein [Sulfurimonas sp.]|nr:MAG: DUF3187 domain-containing protein [Sulfurimonas sp.]
MKYIISLILILNINVFAYSDKDMDGVENFLDRCPGTAITDLVDFNGCSIKSLISNHHFDIILGIAYSKSDYLVSDPIQTITKSLQIDYFYKDFTLQIYSSTYDLSNDFINDNGLNDTIVSGYYRFKIYDNLLLNLGIGVILPTYDTYSKNIHNKIDYISSINLNYAINNTNIFTSYKYTIVNDYDSNAIIDFKNTNSYNFGLGHYLTQKVYISSSYNNSQSIYSKIPDIQNASVYLYYSIDQHWFSSFSYAYGLSESASKHYASMRIGYYF